MTACKTAWLRNLLVIVAVQCGVSSVASLAVAQTKQVSVGILKMAALTDPWVALQEGIFRQHGLDVRLVEFRSGNEAISALQGGSVDIALAIPGTAMMAIERGFPLVIIAQNEVARSAGPDSGSVQVLKDSPIRSLADLAGKKVGVSAMHSQNTVGVQKLIRDAGVDLKTVQFVEIPFPSHADTLRSKQIDAIATVDPYTTQLQASGVGRVISWNYVESIPRQPLGAWAAKRAYINSNPDIAKKFAASIHAAIAYLNADPDRARAAVVKFTGLDPSLVKEMPPIQWDDKIDLAKWQEVIDLMRSSGDLKKAHKAEDFLLKH